MGRQVFRSAAGRSARIGVLIALACGGVDAGQAPATPSSDTRAGQESRVAVFRTGADLVTVDVSVVDETGRPVRSLTTDDFVLKVDGEVRPLLSAQFINQSASAGTPVSEQYSSNDSAEGGRLIMLVVDQGNIRQGTGNVFIRAADRLLGDLGPGDRVGLSVIPGGQVVDFTAHVALVRQSLERVTGGAPRFTRSQMINRVGIAEALAVDRGESQAMGYLIDRECQANLSSEQRAECAAELESEAAELAAHVRQQTQNSLTALRHILTRQARSPQPKAVVLLSEGLFLGRGLEDVGWVSALASRARTSLYAIHIDDTFADINTSISRASTSQFEDRRLRIDGLHTLVGLARGTVYSTVAGGDTAFARLALELTGYYLLGFVPDPLERDGKPHQIAVQVKRRGVEVRARREFTLDPPSTREPTDEEILAGVLADPLLSADLRMRVASYSFPDPAGANVRVLFTTGLGRSGDELPVRSVAYIVTDEKGTVVTSRIDAVEPRRDDDHRYQTTVTLPPGRYRVKVAGVDASGRRGSVEHPFTARLTQAGDLAVGDLMLSDAKATRIGLLRPTIEGQVGVDAVGAYTEVYSRDAQQLAATTAVLEVAADPNGPALAKSSLSMGETRYATRKVAEGEISLADLSPGEYVARSVVSVGGRPVARLIRPFAYDPSSATRVKVLSAALPGGGSPTPAAFARTDVLQPEVVEFFLSEAEATAAAARAPALHSALATAREGRFMELPPDLGEGEPTEPLTPFLRGLGLYARGELEPAAAQFREALRVSSDFSPATFYLGACYAAGGRDREAVGAWQTTLAAETEAPFVYAFAADAYLRLEDWHAALDTATEAADHWPDDDSVRLRVVRAAAAGGRVAEALDALDPYLERRRDDHEMLFFAMRLLYESSSHGKAVQSASADRARFERYLRAYEAADGPHRALASEWLKALSPGP